MDYGSDCSRTPWMATMVSIPCRRDCISASNLSTSSISCCWPAGDASRRSLSCLSQRSSKINFNSCNLPADGMLVRAKVVSQRRNSHKSAFAEESVTTTLSKFSDRLLGGDTGTAPPCADWNGLSKSGCVSEPSVDALPVDRRRSSPPILAISLARLRAALILGFRSESI